VSSATITRHVFATEPTWLKTKTAASFYFATSTPPTTRTMHALTKLEIGKRYGRLVVVAFGGTNKHRHATWSCVCDCGKPSTVVGIQLRSGATKSCGCLQRERASACSTKHGYARFGRPTPEYRSWVSMHTRCYNPKRDQYQDYGGRGITVCARWHRSNPQGFINFVSDMGDKPASRMSVDRINNDLGYRPSNCRWSTPQEQNRNRRPNNQPKETKCQQ
jgi:hypothetical protein